MMNDVCKSEKCAIYRDVVVASIARATLDTLPVVVPDAIAPTARVLACHLTHDLDSIQQRNQKKRKERERESEKTLKCQTDQLLTLKTH